MKTAVFKISLTLNLSWPYYNIRFFGLSILLCNKKNKSVFIENLRFSY